MNTKNQQENENKMNNNYYYGEGSGRFMEVLHECRVHGGVNSPLTSSLPLTEFWKPQNLEKITAVLKPYLPDLDAQRACKIFEYPTYAINYAGLVRGRPSMTDLMLFDGDLQIALEAKFTEYSRMHDQTVREWLFNEEEVNFSRRSVGLIWYEYLVKSHCTSLRGPQRLYDTISKVGYQFFHRAASACHKTNDASGKKPVLIYQLFFDAANEQNIKDREAFEAELKRWAEILRLQNMKFLILATPVTNAAEVAALYAGKKSEIFEEMADKAVYKFDFDNVKITEVL